jgi:D-glycero-alpha-D-manno-heptose-7-phosphate kinase
MIITKTPLRISFVGGGSDLRDFYLFSDGKVISSAIDKYVYVIVKERFDDKVYLNYSRKEIVNSVDEVEHDLVREAMRVAGIANGVEITTLADVPSEGSGLGSSSSVLVGLLHAFYAYKGEAVTNERLAAEACKIEIDILKKPIGKQDQYAAAYGGINKITFKKNDTVEVQKIDINDKQYRTFGSNLLLFYTDKTRKSSEILRGQKENTKNKLEVLKKMVDLVDLFEKDLIEENYDQLGKLLHKNWQYKKELSPKITNGDIENMYRTALDAGAIGGKISGAGGGGFLLLYVPRESQNKVRQALSGYRELPFFLEKYGSQIIFNQRSYPWK